MASALSSANKGAFYDVYDHTGAVFLSFINDTVTQVHVMIRIISTVVKVVVSIIITVCFIVFQFSFVLLSSES